MAHTYKKGSAPGASWKRRSTWFVLMMWGLRIIIRRRRILLENKIIFKYKSNKIIKAINKHLVRPDDVGPEDDSNNNNNNNNNNDN